MIQIGRGKTAITADSPRGGCQGASIRRSDTHFLWCSEHGLYSLGMSEDHPNVAFFPPVGFATAVAAITLLGYLVPIGVPTGVAGAMQALGVILAVAGIASGVAGIIAFRRAGTNIEPHKPALNVVSGGIYRRTRNPMYLGMVSLALGLGFAFANLWSLPAAAALWVALDRGVIAREEAYLTAKFGTAYTEYLKTAGRWL